MRIADKTSVWEQVEDSPTRLSGRESVCSCYESVVCVWASEKKGISAESREYCGGRGGEQGTSRGGEQGHIH